MHYVYILYSPGSDKYYVGQTADVSQRLQYHNELSTKSYTSRHRPWELRAVLEVPSRGLAMRLERHIKSYKDRGYIRELIESESARRALEERFGQE